MFKLLRRLWLAVALILAASAVLLLTDRERARGGAGRSRTWKIGLVALIESAPIEEAIDGFRHGIEEAGLVVGRDFTITSRNAQGDIATLNAILDDLNGDDTDLIRGEDPARIPFHPSDKLRRAVNLDHARRLKVVIPAEIVDTADLVIASPARAP